MIESIARFVLDLVMPMNLIMILLVAAALFLMARFYRLSAGFLITGLMVTLISVTPFLPNRLVTGLENRYPVLHDPSLIDWPAITDQNGADLTDEVEVAQETGGRIYADEVEVTRVPAGVDVADADEEESGTADVDITDTHVVAGVTRVTKGADIDRVSGAGDVANRAKESEESEESELSVKAAEVIHIMVLGGGHNPDPWLPATGRLSERALGRLTEGIRLHRLIPESQLIFSGWSSSRGESVAEVMGRAAIELGVDSLRISLLTEPSNTCREAQAYLSEFGAGNRLILITSALHMPRAVQLFRQNGLDPVPAPTGFRIKFHPDRRYFHINIDAGNISKLESSIKEHVGMQWSRQTCR